MPGIFGRESQETVCAGRKRAIRRRIHFAGQYGAICQIDRRLTCRIRKYIAKETRVARCEINQRFCRRIENPQ